MLTGTGSFRNAKKSDMIMWTEPMAVICADVVSRQRDFDLELSLPLKSAPYAKINGIKRPVSKGLSDILSCVAFAPSDLFIVSSSPSQRRDFMDRALKQLRPNYTLLLSKYQKLMEGKNKILKNWDTQPQFREILPEYTDKMAALSASIITYRNSFLDAISPFALKAQSEMSSEKEHLVLKYSTVSTVTDKKADALTIYKEVLSHSLAHYDAELASRVCLSGIHKDDIEIEINGRPAKLYASQGQTRTAALALKLAEHSLFYKENGEYPILLLDDVFSELDGKRREYILKKAQSGQVIITSCFEEKEGFPSWAGIIRP